MESLTNAVCEELAANSGIRNAYNYIKCYPDINGYNIVVDPAVYKNSVSAFGKTVDASENINNCIGKAIQNWEIDNGINAEWMNNGKHRL